MLIDDTGVQAMSTDGAQQKLAATWQLIAAPCELAIALSDPGDSAMAAPLVLPPGTVLAGDLSEMQPSDLLNFLHHGRRTGVLLTRSDGTERGIVLIEGNIAWACSTSPGERLGDLLIRDGLADRAQVESALADQGTPSEKRLGQMLIERGVLGPDEVLRGLRHKVVEIFLGLLVARSGSFVFLRGIEREKLPAQLMLDTQAMLLDGLRRLDEMELYRTRVPAPESVPRATRKMADGEVSADGHKILSAVDGKRTVAMVGALTALGEFEATKAIYKLIERGYLEL